MKPTVGRIVLFNSTNPEFLGNGATEVPAIITRVWSDICVNLTVFRDNAPPLNVNSVCEVDDFAGSATAAAHGWHWMPYQKAVAAGEASPVQHAAA